MKKRVLFFWLSGLLTAAALAAAVSAPAEVLENLGFFSDFELVANLEIVEEEPAGEAAVKISTAPAVSTAAVTGSSVTVKAAAARRSYEKN
ncbi:MAG: hypothetical protein PHV33_06415 [Elusimicrobiales bacterium]|nr:hypothetical protein [Elusimicrobiales bacterium]